MLLDNLKSDLIKALKLKDSACVETLRYLLAAIKYLEIDKYPPSVGGSLTQDDILSVILKQVKTHKESIEMFEKGKRDDLVLREKAQLEILERYLPKQMSQEEIRVEIREVKAKLAGEGRSVNFGILMGEAMKSLKGKTDGSLVVKMVKEELG